MDAELYWNRKEAGLCTECGTDDKKESNRLCQDCYASDRESKLKYYFKNKQSIDADRQRRREHNRRIGKCDDCGELGQNSTYCAECYEKRSARKKRKRQLHNEMNKTQLDFSIELRELFTH